MTRDEFIAAALQGLLASGMLGSELCIEKAVDIGVRVHNRVKKLNADIPFYVSTPINEHKTIHGATGAQYAQIDKDMLMGRKPFPKEIED